jgi:hypothetical protein
MLVDHLLVTHPLVVAGYIAEQTLIKQHIPNEQQATQIAGGQLDQPMAYHVVL